MSRPSAFGRSGRRALAALPACRWACTLPAPWWRWPAPVACSPASMRARGGGWGVGGGGWGGGGVAGGGGARWAWGAGTGGDLWRMALGESLSAGVGSDGKSVAVVSRNNALIVVDSGRERWRG